MQWNRILDALYAGRVDEAAALTEEALERGHAAQEVLNEGLLAGMEKVGKDFKADLLFLPEVLIAAKAMHAGMDILRPLLSESDSVAPGTFVIGTVKGDLHDIEKNLVAMMMQGAGLEVIDLGTDIPPEKFAEVIENHQPQIMGMSALLTTTIGEMKITIEALEEAGLRDRVKIMLAARLSLRSSRRASAPTDTPPMLSLRWSWPGHGSSAHINRRPI